VKQFCDGCDDLFHRVLTIAQFKYNRCSPIEKVHPILLWVVDHVAIGNFIDL
jgi:hypothetical protein